MPFLELSNPFRRGTDRPSLKECVASLKETASRLTSGTKPAPKAVPDAPDARAFAVAQAPVSAAKVEAELMALLAEYEGFARVSDDASIREDAVGLPLPDDLDNAIDRVRYFTNQGREDTVRHAMALPATTLLAFGLRAQILEHDAGPAWDESEADVDNMRCRALLHGLISAAGLSPIPRLEVTSDEIRGWLTAPETAPGASRVKA